MLRLVVERAHEGSRPGARSDSARIALAIEGGGMAGCVSAGMAVGLELLGLVDSFDVVYGASAGSMNASYLAARQAGARSDLYPLAAQQGLIDLRRGLTGRPPFRLAEIVRSLFVRFPHDRAVLEAAPGFRVTAARLAEKRLDVLGDWASLEELRTGVWASASIPVLAGDVVTFRGRQYVDGGLLESIPYRVALAEGATHVLVLRSRHAWYRKHAIVGWQRRALDRVLRSTPDTVREMIFERPARYNAEACDLQLAGSSALTGRVTQLSVRASGPHISQVESDPRKLRAAIIAGTRVTFDALTTGGRRVAVAA